MTDSNRTDKQGSRNLYLEHKQVIEMIDILSDYLQIYSRHPANTFLTKEQRKMQHSELMKWVQHKYQVMPEIDEIQLFMNTNDTLKYEQPFFLKVVVPCVQKDIDNNNTKSLRFLFECNGMDDYRINNSGRDYVIMFCLGTNYKYDSLELADMILSDEPDNEVVLYYKYKCIKQHLGFSVHEVPLGVLSGNDLANKEHMQGMNNTLREFALLAKKLHKDDDLFIQECTAIYTAWEQYLDDIESYNSFEDYLMEHNIPYK